MYAVIRLLAIHEHLFYLNYGNHNLKIKNLDILLPPRHSLYITILI